MIFEWTTLHDCHETFGMIVEELTRRRQALNKLAIDILPREEQLRLGLSETQILDGNAQAVCQLLRGRVNTHLVLWNLTALCHHITLT